MKKVFFTAIAMVAFSAVSFANTIEVKEEVVPVEKKEITTVKVEDDKRTPCDNMWIGSFLSHGGGTSNTNDASYATGYADAYCSSHGC